MIMIMIPYRVMLQMSSISGYLIVILLRQIGVFDALTVVSVLICVLACTLLCIAPAPPIGTHDPLILFLMTTCSL